MNSSINKWHGIRCISINMADIDHTRQYIKFIYLLFLFSISVWCCCCWLDLETVGLAFLQCRGILVFRFVFPPLCMYCPVSEWLMNFGLNQTQPYKKNGVVSCVYGGRRVLF
jgi:hypothetical protein